MDNFINNDFFRNILNQAGIVAYLDRAGRYVYVNKPWQIATGMPESNVLGRSAEEVIRGSAALLSIRTGKVISGEMFMRTNAGRELQGIMKYTPIKDSDNEITGCLVTSIFSDMDEAQAFNERFEHIMEEFGYISDHSDFSGMAKYKINDIIGNSPEMQRVREQIYIAGSTNASCLIEGETGTGKELVAHAIHNCSRRSLFPFIRVNCSAIPENLMESEFFGYEEGSFTGGVKGGRAGKFEKAHLGSMFLDEINAMDLSMQPKLLRALQEKEIERIGGVESVPVDVRVIAASNMPLDYLVEKGVFRRDLYYRLNIITIKIPPLRQRKEDIYPLLQLFLQRYHDEANGYVSDISSGAVEYLCEKDWPGNVRELQNAVERAVAGTGSNILTVDDFRKFEPEQEIFGKSYIMNTAFLQENENIKYGNTEEAEEKEAVSEEKRERVESLSEVKNRNEREAVINALKQCGGNRSRAARMLDISRTMLYKKLEKYNIK
ncbi:MAG: sigma 54-interacting transcriptional regulator [Clostridia bacterium]|nr:sigma 54-interacting transcriptional regulator [Clostridia bacterium]